MSKLIKATTIVMEEDANVLGDVIVTGYQTVSKERATGAFGTVRSEQLQAKLNSDLKNVMEGQIAGVVLDKRKYLHSRYLYAECRNRSADCGGRLSYGMFAE